MINAKEAFLLQEKNIDQVVNDFMNKVGQDIENAANAGLGEVVVPIMVNSTVVEQASQRLNENGYRVGYRADGYLIIVWGSTGSFPRPRGHQQPQHHNTPPAQPSLHGMYTPMPSSLYPQQNVNTFNGVFGNQPTFEYYQNTGGGFPTNQSIKPTVYTNKP